MNGSEHDLGRIWLDLDAHRRFAAVVRRSIVLAALVILAVGTIASIAASRAAIADEEDDELSFAAVVALAPQRATGELLTSAGRRGLLIRNGEIIEVHDDDGGSGTLWDRWRTRTRNTALDIEPLTRFTSSDPAGVGFSHIAVPTYDDGLLVVSRPSSRTLALAWQVSSITIATTGALLLALGLGWAIAHRRIVVPTQALLEAGESLLVRGSISPALTRRLDAVGERPLELGRLARVLQAIAEENRIAWSRQEALLASARSLGTSLDRDVVLHRMLDHLKSLLGVERSAIVRFDPRSDAVTPVVVRGHSEDYVKELTERVTGSSLPSVRAARDNSPVLVSDTEAEVVDDVLRQRARRHGYRSVLAIPLTSDLEAPTVLLLHSPTPRTYSYDEIQISKSFGSIAGAALRNAELFARVDDRLQQETSRLEAIVESVDEGLIVGGSDGSLLFTNVAMRQLVPEDQRVEPFERFDDFLDAISHRAVSQPATRAALASLASGADGQCDIELFVGNRQLRTFRVRRFVVRDARGGEIGFGQTWTDASRDRELETMKKGLLAAVSHEFRTPLALIKGYATTLLAEDVSWNREEQEEFLRLVSHEADRLSVLVQRLLDMRRIDAGIVSLEVMPTPLEALVESAVGGVLVPRNRFEIDALPDVEIECDAARVVTAIRNVLENACEYSPNSEPVTISASVDDSVAVISIRDRGIGVPAELRDHVFATFVRGDSGLTAEHGGVGLGLSISRGFIEAHGGRVWIEDPPSGPGSIFNLELPLLAITDRLAI